MIRPTGVLLASLAWGATAVAGGRLRRGADAEGHPRSATADDMNMI